MADSFINSSIARDLEYQQCAMDPPTIVQFGARSAQEFAAAVELVSPFVDGVDLNCGCPQSWALDEGIGASLMNDPEHLKDMISQARGRTDNTPVAVKMRVFEERGRTVELARTIEAAGAAWLTIHGRTRHQKSNETVNYETIRLIKESVNIPVVANGDIDSLGIATEIEQKTKVDGVMTARALLENPALFAGYDQTPWECIEKFIRYSLEYGTQSSIFHHHLAKMTTSILSPSNHRMLNSLTNASIPAILDFLQPLRPC